MTIYDVFGRKMLQRTRLKSGKYSLTGLPELKSNGRGADESPEVKKWHAEVKEGIRNSQPDRFFFDGSAPVMRVAARHAKHPEDAGPDFLTPEADEQSRSYWAIAETTRYDLIEELRSITYIGPLREPARRLYVLSGEMPRNVGTRGEYAPEILFRWRDDAEKMGLVHDWLAKFGFEEPLILTPQGPGAFSLSWRAETEHATDTAFVDMGFGLSQVLPLIVQGVMANKRSTIVAEQPEIHLNPKLQTVLGELFAFIISRGVNVLTETHSEHLLLTVRRLMAEKEVSSESVALYFVERENRDSTIREVALEENGHIEAEAWPSGFFADALRESLALSAAQASRDAD